MNPRLLSVVWLICGSAVGAFAEEVTPVFQGQEICARVQIGYGLALADIDGDARTDIVLADKTEVVWYRNPGWERFVIAEKLTDLDNVCVAVTQVNGKPMVVAGAGWNPSDTVGSGAVFHLVCPEQPTNRWKAVRLHHEPTVHRMRWISTPTGQQQLVVLPLHGRGNRDGHGAGVRVLGYTPAKHPGQTWETASINDQFHLTHNFETVQWTGKPGTELLIAAKEGIFHLVPSGTGWEVTALAGPGAGHSNFRGAGEVRAGRLKGGRRFFVTVEPMHGNELVLYVAPLASEGRGWNRQVLDHSLREGHALGCGDLLELGGDQVVVGWRARNAEGKVGLKLFQPADKGGSQWLSHLIDDDAMACEDLALGDLNGDGRLDVVASGRATKNLKIYWNRAGRP